jgi:hypothetical protein
MGAPLDGHAQLQLIADRHRLSCPSNVRLKRQHTGLIGATAEGMMLRYVVIGIRWEIELEDGTVSIKLAKDIHIAQGCGQVGKFLPDDLVPA